MTFKKLSKIIALSLAILVACSATPAKAVNTDSKSYPVLPALKFGAWIGFSWFALQKTDKHICQPLARRAFNQAGSYSRNGGGRSAIGIFNAAGHLQANLKYVGLAVAIYSGVKDLRNDVWPNEL